jgi:magnesium transporter
MARTRLYRDGELVRENFPVSEISDRIVEPNAFVWLDYCAPTGAELATIAQELNLHPLAVEDAVSEHQRPKLDRYDSHLFVNAYTLALDTASGGGRHINCVGELLIKCNSDSVGVNR